MLFKASFQKFDFTGFLAFISCLGKRFGMNQIVFEPDHKELFVKEQLTHVVGRGGLDDRSGFLGAWRQEQGAVRNVHFDLFSENGSKKVKMGINLDDQSISLYTVSGISVIEIKQAFEENVAIEKIEMPRRETIAILSKGKNAILYKNTIGKGFDVGIEDEGEGTAIVKNVFNKDDESDSQNKEISKWYRSWWAKYIFWPFIVLLLVSIIVSLRD